MPPSRDFDSILAAEANDDSGTAAGLNGAPAQSKEAARAAAAARRDTAVATIAPTELADTTAGPTGSRLDEWWARRLSTRLRRRVWQWAGPTFVTLLAAVLRLWHLGSPHSLVFDETFYVKDAWSMVTLGYEGQWPVDVDPRFNAGATDLFTSTAEYIAHPPLGKWIISLGMQALGPQSAVGWRLSTAVVGVLAVALVCLIAWALFRSTVLATIAGGLMAVDGLAIVMSRTALLDNSLMFLCLLAFGAILLDRGQSRRRLVNWMARRAESGRGTDWGPALWWRPWLITAALLFGFASGVKWSGIYYFAGFVAYTLVVDVIARRREGIAFWGSSTVFKQVPATLLLTVPVAALAYLSTWTGWLITRGGYDRNWADAQAAAGAAATSPPVTWIPRSLQSLWHYQTEIYGTNLSLSTPHNYQANPLTWLLLQRPTAFFYRGETPGQNGCTFDGCAEYISSIANPVLWWLAVIAALYLVYRLIRRREWQVGLILAGVAGGYLPWLLYTNRTVFQFYTIVFLPYLILGLTLVIGLILGTANDPRRRRMLGIRVVASGLVVIILVSAFFWSAWTGIQVPELYQRMHYWLPSWP